MYFRYFGIMSPWKGCGHPTERKKTHLKSFCPGMHFAKFGWNWPNGFGKEYENMKSLQTDGRMDNGQQTLIKIRVHYRYTRTQFLLSKGHLKNKAWNYISNLGGNFKVCVYVGGGGTNAYISTLLLHGSVGSRIVDPCKEMWSVHHIAAYS